MTLKLIVKHSHGNCPNCDTKLKVIVPKGEGTVTRHIKTTNQVRGIKKQIVEAYLRDPEKEFTTKQIILRINYIRHLKNQSSLERSNLTRPHSELVGEGIICDLRQEGYDHIYKINPEKARGLKLQ